MTRSLLPMLNLPAKGCDCRSCPFFMGDPARNIAPGIEPVCSGRNSSCSYCGCSRSEGAARQGGCGTCPIRCGSRVDIKEWMADVRGTMSFDDIAFTLGLPALPSFVPMVDAVATARQVDGGFEWPAYALGFRRVFSPKTHRIFSSWEGRTARAALGLGIGQRAMLVSYGEDPLVEAFWTRRHDGLIEQLATQQWDVVLAPNFSMYGNQPRTEHLLNFRRNLMIAEELNDAGVPAVPNIYWFRLEDLERYVSWIADTEPSAIAINCQTFRTDSDWQSTFLPGATYLAICLDELNVATKVIINGASRADRLADLRRLFGDRLIVVSQNPIQYARHGAVMTSEGRQDLRAAVPEAFAATVRYYASLLGSER